MTRTALVVLGAVLSTVACKPRGDPWSGAPAQPAPQPATQQTQSAESDAPQPVGFEMRNVRLRAAPDVTLHVTNLRGRLISRRGAVPVFDDQQSFYIDVEGAALSMDASSMTALVNTVFSYKGSPLSDLKVALRDGRLQQEGKLKKGLPIPFSVEADVQASDGQVRLHPVKVKAGGIPTTKLMDLFGLELDDLIKVRGGRGVAVRDNDLLLTPSQMLPSPEVRGRVTTAAVKGDRLLLVLGDPAAARSEPAAGAARNFIWFRGGRIRFGRLTMTNTDLQLIDADPRDPFDFYSERYNDQLVAGYSRNTPSGALRTHMPDYEDLKSGRRLTPPPIGNASAAAPRARAANALR